MLVVVICFTAPAFHIEIIGLRSHLCSQVVALQQGRTLTKHSVHSKHHGLSDGDQPGRLALHEEEGQVPETEGPQVSDGDQPGNTKKLNYLGYIPRDAPQSLHLHLIQTDVAISAKHYTYI